MADEALARSGLYFDELNKIRVFEPEAAQQTQALKENCQEFLESEFVRNHSRI
jgi:intraflagellar transport protein 20